MELRYGCQEKVGKVALWFSKGTEPDFVKDEVGFTMEEILQTIMNSVHNASVLGVFPFN
ncbi:unnamed protein product [Sphenostylis stenocarpa]|uniref:Uncharacterized protein n=1 Tax=Sphenostylis stenocarpa TaxID=92480 RepID=A0AA86SJP2_9FABA|nr:unnamed protein product [Sphenostylis stenocarpa]